MEDACLTYPKYHYVIIPQNPNVILIQMTLGHRIAINFQPQLHQRQ
jgi:hypothetical protein